MCLVVFCVQLCHVFDCVSCFIVSLAHGGVLCVLAPPVCFPLRVCNVDRSLRCCSRGTTGLLADHLVFSDLQDCNSSRVRQMSVSSDDKSLNVSTRNVFSDGGTNGGASCS